MLWTGGAEVAAGEAENFAATKAARFICEWIRSTWLCGCSKSFGLSEAEGGGSNIIGCDVLLVDDVVFLDDVLSLEDLGGSSNNVSTR
jgi:hypothetical protein